MRSLIARFAVAVALPLAALSFAASTAAPAHAQDMPPGAKQPSEFPRAKLTAGMFVIDAAVASNDADREQGLMYRTTLAPTKACCSSSTNEPCIASG